LTTASAQPLTDLFNQLRDYQVRGYSVLPIFGIKDGHCLCPDGPRCSRSSGKHPHRGLAPNGSKNSTTDESQLRDFVKRNIGGNWAIATGMPMLEGGYLGVLDVDIRNGGDESLADLESKFGKLPDTPRMLSGGGGYHFYFRTMSPLACRLVAPGLDFKGTGGYVLTDPSNHLLGTYVWDCGAHISDVPLADIPKWLIEGTTQDRERPQWSGITARESLLGEAFALAGLLGDQLANGTYAVNCPWSDLHSDGRGKGKDSSTVILPPIEGTTFGSFSCAHGHCNHRNWSEIIKILPPAAVAGARQKFPLKPQAVLALPKNEQIAQIATENPLKYVQNLLHYKTTKGGHVVASDVTNVITILTYDPRWQVDGKPILAFDEFGQQLTFGADAPWHPDDAPHQFVDFWRDQDTTRLISWMSRNYDFNADKEMVYAGAQVVGRRYSSHPIKAWLNTLTWDGVPRVEQWLTKYLGVEDSPYSRKVGTWWLVSAIARVMMPGCKADHVLILEGAQGIRKSTALETLCRGRDWFSDTPFEIGNKDAYLHLRGKWIVELAELDTMNRSDSARAKAFFSSPADTYRAPYGRETITVPRQCVFAGSVNHDAYLRDETGNRRYWPVKCGAIDLELLRSERELLWAEAVVLYGQGQKWWPASAADAALCAEQQDSRAEQDEWQTIIMHWMASTECKQILAEREGGAGLPGYLTVGDVLSRALLIQKSQWDKPSQIRVGKILMNLRWAKRRVGFGDDRIYAYVAL
jgi:predicted P-loop ATPase